MILECADLRDALEELEVGLKADHPEALNTWKKEVIEWEKDQTKLNLYKRSRSSMLFLCV